MPSPRSPLLARDAMNGNRRAPVPWLARPAIGRLLAPIASQPRAADMANTGEWSPYMMVTVA
jgi:hypothetical protein